MTGLPTGVPLTFVFLIRFAIVDPLQVASPLCKSISASPGPGHRFVGLRMRVPDFAAALRVCNKTSRRERLRVDRGTAQ